MRRLYFLSLLALVLPATAFAAPQTFQQLAAQIVSLLNAGITVLIVLGLVVYFYGISTNIIKMGEGKIDTAKAYFVWGILALFLMVSVWGILALLRNTIFGTNTSTTNSGTSQFTNQRYLNI